MYNDESLYWIWLADKCGAASSELSRLTAKYDTPFELYRLDEEELSAIDGISVRLKNAMCDKSLESSYSVLKHCKENGIGILTYSSPRYPARLKTLEDPPAVLYYRGKLPDFDSRLCIAVVGTRKMSEYGKQSAYRISYELAAAHVVVVSGMALGVDGVAAGGAIASGGDTVAVLGCGIDIVYPREHEKLMRAIENSGVVITEYPPSERPAAYNFPKRNRIISGLCQGTFVVEGAKGSGSLITASKALAQGREIFALPANIGQSNSEGPNELIKNGANVALCADDIISHYDFLYHDVIDYRGLHKAKERSLLNDCFLIDLGVTDRHYRGRYDNVTEKMQPASSDDSVADGKKIVLQNSHSEPGKENNSSFSGDGQAVSDTPADDSNQILMSLDSETRTVFEHMPIDKAISPDSITDTGLDIGATVTALTMLELNGLVTSLPGGLYIRK